MFQVHVMLVLVWDIDGITWGWGTSMYIKYPDRGENIYIEVFRDLEVAVEVCSDTDG
jgi:hypothetical protein